MENENQPKENKNGFIITAIIVAVIIIGFWLLTLYLLRGDADRGTFGDMFGSVNALFSGFALAGIILTILLQQSELKLQREELKETRKEFQIQNETLRLQRFENTFFHLLDLHHKIVDGMDYRHENTNLSLLLHGKTKINPQREIIIESRKRCFSKTLFNTKKRT